MSESAPRWIGRSVKRSEDHRFLVGRGRYLDDLRLPGLLHLALVRSPHAHARVLGIDGRPALGRPGVQAVITAADLDLAAGVPPLVPTRAFPSYVHPVLVPETVRHAGEAVAAVVADDPYRAADALDAVMVEYAPLPAVADAEAALRNGAPRVHERWRDNLAGVSGGQVGDARRGLDEADVVVEASLRYPRVLGLPIEPRGVVAATDEATGLLTVWASTQVPFAVRSAVATALRLPEAQVRVVVPDVGGGFGTKGHVYPEDLLVPAVARRLGRPVKWVETRQEHFVAAAADRDQVHRARLGVRRDGTLVALESEFSRDLGPYPALGDAITLNTINHLPGPYRVPHFRATGRNVVTNKTFAAAYRGAGRPEAAFVLERLLDRAARALGMDPADLRRRNLIRPDEMPYASGLTYRDGVSVVYDPADFPAAFEKALALLDYPAWRAEQDRRRGGARPLGIGLAAYVEGTGLGPYEGAQVRVDPNGTVYVLVGVSTQGQAHETTLAQICADQLGVPIEQIVVLGGDTQLVGYGMGTIASRVAAVAGPAVARTAREVAAKARLVAADLLECAPDDLVLSDGRVAVRGVPGRGVALAEVARAAVRSPRLKTAGGPGLEACVFYYPDTVTWAFGAHGCVVDVDVDTCAVRLLKYVAVHDCGQPINPMVVDGQLHGGIAQGIGSALTEELVYDAQGQLLTGSLLEYGLPRADEIPPLDVLSLDYPSPLNELGIKGVGESGIIAPGAAVANAVEDALADRGVRVEALPISGVRLFGWLAEARRAAGPA
ncbi:MAG TPA: xanthine dehydrogenase family protein molybdopterin-binding subunit [Methylomirabilota bacterium]|nr:xanthine dehydrogenase family protein molybdopterin-binding subunit [Methylomirabilota bacterium]